MRIGITCRFTDVPNQSHQMKLSSKINVTGISSSVPTKGLPPGASRHVGPPGPMGWDTFCTHPNQLYNCLIKLLECCAVK